MVNRIVLSLLVCFLIFPVFCYAGKSGHVFRAYKKEIKRTYGFDVLGTSSGTSPQFYGITFISHQKVNIDQARILLVNIHEGFKQKLNSDKKLRPYFYSFPLTHRNVEIGITFFDEENHFQRNGFVASVINVKDKVLYSVFKGGFMLEDLYEEPYEEAYRIVCENHCLTQDGL